MSSRSIQWIITLMTISLVGIISFQANWIWLTLKEKEAEFDSTIAEVLSEVDERMQDSEVSVFVKSHKIIDDSTFGFVQVVSDDVVLERMQLDGAPNIEEIEEELKSITEDNNAVLITQIADIKRNAFIADSTAVHRKRVVRYNKKKEVIKDVVNKLTWEFAIQDISLEERLKEVDIQNLIDISLKDHGVKDMEFSYAIKDLSKDSIILASENYVKEEADLEYERGIFEIQDVDQGGILTLGFPSKTNYLLNSIWLLLTLSILLTAVMVYTFSYTVKAILKQKKVSKIKSDFINNMTHEFKTPLATISLAVDSMLHQEVKKNEKELERFGKIIKKENQRMNTQIERVLEMALFDKKDIQIKLEKLNVHQMIKELKEDFTMKRDSLSGDIKLALEADRFHIIGDKMHFYNALRNLLDNAIKFSDREFRICIKTYIENNYVAISVSDKGIGMNKETQERIFDRFYRKTEGDLHQTKGFGLGLAYTKEILSKMNAQIRVKSKLNEGSTFTILVPYGEE